MRLHDNGGEKMRTALASVSDEKNDVACLVWMDLLTSIQLLTEKNGTGSDYIGGGFKICKC